MPVPDGRAAALVEAFEREAAGLIGPGYCRTRRGEFRLQTMLMPEVFARPFNRALDIGCGIGFKALLLGDVATEVDGVDLDVPYLGFAGSEPAVVAGARVLGRIGCAWARLRGAPDLTADLRAHAGGYDLIVSDYLVEHLADLAPFHAAVLDALLPGGTVIHTVPNTHDAIEPFVRLNARPRLREIAKAVIGLVRGGRRQSLTRFGTLVPIPHSEFLTDYGAQFDVYRVERTAYSMIETGFTISHLQPTREHSYTIVGRRPA